MLVDFRAHEQSTYSADVGVVGSGAAGLSLGVLLARAGHSVILIESGDSRKEGEANELSTGVADSQFTGLTAGRLRSLGGTTRIWSGGCIPLDAIDLTKRDWVQWSGWPFEIGQLVPFYREAAKLLNLGDGELVQRALKKAGFDGSVFSSEDVNATMGVFCPQHDFSKIFRKATRSTNLTVVVNATVTNINIRQSGAFVESLDVSSLHGQRASVHAKYYVLCAGAIENARILLSSNRVMACGIGNRHDLVGRFFQDHPSTTIADVLSDDPINIQKKFSYVVCGRRLMLPRLTLTANYQKQERILSAYALPVASYDTRSLPYVLKRLRHVANNQNRSSADTNTSRGPPSRLVALLKHAGPSRLFRASRLRLQIVTEQAPDPQNRITLSDKKDRLSVPLAKVSWRVGDIEQRTIQKAGEVFSRIFYQLGLGHLSLDKFLYGPIYELNSRVNDTYHHAGTTRMADAPESGVVDMDNKVHGIANLYVSGASVMPTSGSANPTFTIVALSIRLSEHLKSKLRHS